MTFGMKVTLTVPALLAGVLLAQSGAGGPDRSVPLSKVERKGKAPVSDEVLRVRLPRPIETKLSNGLTVLLLEDHRLPSVSMRLTLQGAGAIYEPAAAPGLASFTADMLKEGTATRDSRQIAEDIEKLGATMNASAAFGSTIATVSASGLSDTFPELMALLADTVLHPAFPESELAKLKGREKAQLLQMRTRPMFLMRERFNRAVYGTHPAAVMSPTVASIDAMTPELLRKWHNERYVPQNSILGIAGDVTMEQVRKALGPLGAWEKTGLPLAPPPASKPAASKKIWLVDRPGSVQTTLLLGNIALTRTDPDYIPMVVMDRIVGGGPAARLFLNLRENKGYTYGAYSFLNATLFAGPWAAYADVRSQVTEGSMTEFMNEVRRIREEKAPNDEMADAKRSLVAGFALSLESPAELLQYATTQKIYGLPADYWDTYPAKIDAVTADDVQRVARKYIDPSNLQIVAVGDAAKIRTIMEKFGPVEVYGADGKPESPATPDQPMPASAPPAGSFR